MSLHELPIGVRVVSPKGVESIITNYVENLRFRCEIPGGFADASFDLAVPFDKRFLKVFSKIYIYDTRNSRILWQGYLENPGYSLSESDQKYTLNAVGTSARLDDFRMQHFYAAGGTDKWSLVAGTSIAGDLQNSGEGIRWGFPKGKYIVYNESVDVFDVQKYFYNWGAVARYSFTIDMVSAAEYLIALYGLSNVDGQYVWIEQFTQFSGSSFREVVITTDFDPAERIWCMVHRYCRSGAAGTISDDLEMIVLREPRIIYVRYKATGELDTAAASYPHYYVTASEVVPSIIGRQLRRVYDAYNIRVEKPSAGETQIFPFVFADGATDREVLNELIKYEPNCYYAVWEDTPNNNMPRFEWRVWNDDDPDDVKIRYIIYAEDGYNIPKSSSSLYNGVLVRFKFTYGSVESDRWEYIYNTNVEEISEAFDSAYVRAGFLDLGSDEANQQGNIDTAIANAENAGNKWLDESEVEKTGASALVARKIVDLETGLMVDPQEIRPGCIVKIYGIDSYGKWSESTTTLDRLRNGVSIFRLMSTEFATDSGTTTLEFDQIPFSLAEAIAENTKRSYKYDRRT